MVIWVPMNVAYLLDRFYDYVYDALLGANDTKTGTFIDS